MPDSYDEGVLELTAHLFRRRHCDRRVSRLVHVLTLELTVPIPSAGAMTLRKKSVLKGVEPDDVERLCRIRPSPSNGETPTDLVAEPSVPPWIEETVETT